MEIYISVARKVVSPSDFADLEELAEHRLRGALRAVGEPALHKFLPRSRPTPLALPFTNRPYSHQPLHDQH